MTPSENSELFNQMWFLLALANAYLAGVKGRGKFNWFMLSLMIGPWATFFIIYSDRPKKSK